MASPALSRSLNVGGRLCANPGDLTTAFPHGGVDLGEAVKVQLFMRTKYSEITADELGDETTDVLYIGASWLLRVVLRGFDPDAISRIAPNSTAVSATGTERIVQHPGASATIVRAGTLLGNGVSLPSIMFSADNPKAPSVLLYRAIGIFTPSPHDFDFQDPHEMVCDFVAIRRSSDGKAGAYGRRERLSL